MVVVMPNEIDRIARLQKGVVTRRQALAYGFTRHMVTARVESKRWQSLHDGVYYVHSGPVPRVARLWAAVLRVGHGAVLSHETAAEVWKIIDEQSREIHVSVPREIGKLKVRGVTLHYTSRLPMAEFPPIGDGIPPVTWPYEAVFDLVNGAPNAEDAVAWAIKACQRKTTTPDLIRMCLLRPGHGRLRWRTDVLDALTEVRAGVQSPLERRYLRDVERAHRLPDSERQVKTVRGTEVRFHHVRYVDYGVGVELDGVRWHTADTHDRDVARDNTSLLDDVWPLRYGWSHVAYHPCEVAHQVWTLLVRRRKPETGAQRISSSALTISARASAP